MIRRLFHLEERGPGVEAGVEWEIAHHLEERTELLMSQGWSRADAEAEARRAFGDLERYRRELRRIDRERQRRLRYREWLETVAQDIRHTLRAVHRSPGFATALVLTLGLGIGANAALFAVADALLLRPLPYSAPGELSQLVWHPPQEPGAGMPYVSHELAREWQRRSGSAERSVLHTSVSVLFTEAPEPQTVTIEAVTPAFEETLGVAPMLGRGLLPEDAVPGAPDVVLLAHEFWRTQLGGAPVLGRALELEGVPHTVIGVMPAGFKFPEYSTRAAWIALREDGTVLGAPAAMVDVKVRVPESEHAAAAARTTAVAAALREALPSTRDQVYTLRRWSEGRARNPEVRRAVGVLGGAVVLILLVAGFNMVSLLLVRAAARTRELAVRMAIGASRRRVVRQLATEAMVLALMSGAAAVLVAWGAIDATQGIMPDALTFFSPHAFTVERRTLLFTFVVALLSGFLFGVLPAFRAARQTHPAQGAALTVYAGRTSTAVTLRRGLVVAEVAISVLLLAAGGLLINSFVRLARVEPGFALDRLALLRLEVPKAAYAEADVRAAYLHRLEERLEGIPGVGGVTLASGLPPHADFSFGIELEPEGGAARPVRGLLPSLDVRPDFFAVTGAQLLAGRPFTAGDPRSHVIVDEDLAQFLWPEGDVVGRRFRMFRDAEPLTVVGVMRDLKLLGPDDRTGDFELLRPFTERSGQLAFGIRVNGDPGRIFPAVRDAVHEVDPRQPILELAAADDVYATAIETPRFLLVLVTALAALALTLAVVGIYAVLAFGVTQRRQELAVRMALGASAAAVRRMIVREGVVLAAGGAALGMLGALLAGNFLRASLFGVEPHDPPTLTLVLLTVLLSALLACLVPARRAARIQPMQVLRAE